MVAVVKPKVYRPTPASDLEFLRFVRQKIESESERFICNAIERTARSVGGGQQAIKYALRARAACGKYPYYSQWIINCNPELARGENWRVTTRLALLDEWIAECERENDDG